MRYHYHRTDSGPVQLAVFNWAGTTADYGCIAPAAVFVEGFRRRSVTMPQARGPMGVEKRAHIQTLAAAEQETKRRQARNKLAVAGAHLVLDGVWDAPAAVQAINTRLARGDQP